MKKVILASKSVYRAALLKQLGIPFIVIPADIDEIPYHGESPESLSKRLAIEKAMSISSQNQGAVVIGADQVADLDGEILVKPENETLAIRQLEKQSGQSVRFYSAFTIMETSLTGPPKIANSISITRVKFKNLNSQEIRSYLEKDRPYDCTGSFKVESLGIALCSEIISDDPSSLLGLPLIQLIQILKDFEIRVI